MSLINTNMIYNNYIQSLLQEVQIQFNRNRDVDFGNVVILAGGSASGKGFTINNMLGISGKVMDVDALKLAALKSKTVIDRAMKEFGVNVADFQKDGALKDPEIVRKLHALIGDQLGITDAKQRALFTNISVAAPDRKPNLIFDVTLSSVSKLVNLSGSLRDLGYSDKKIHIVWVLNSIEVAKSQNAKRSRTVPEAILMNTHEGVSITMAQLLRDSAELRKHVDGDIFIAFNQAKVDIEKVKSPDGGAYIKKAKYVQIKKVGSAIDAVSLEELVDKIASYVPNPERWTRSVNENFQSGGNLPKPPVSKRTKEDEIERSRQATLPSLITVDGWDFVSTAHAGSQSMDRRPEYKRDDWKEFNEKIAKKLNNFKAITTAEKIFYSRKMEQGYVTSVNVDKKTVRIITVLPKGKNNPAPGTERIMMEISQEREIFFVD